jgi:hypothetical protein
LLKDQARIPRAWYARAMPPEFLTPEEARALLEAADRRRAKLRAEHPAAAHVFPPVSDEIFRYVMEKAFLGELRNPPALPPLDDDN